MTLTPVHAQSNTYIVDPGRSDLTDDGSSGNPWQTIQRAAGQCGPLPAPTGNVIDVDPSQAANLDDIVNSATSGDTILLADGAYELHGDYLRFDTPGVTLHSASGNREAVIIDGNYETTEFGADEYLDLPYDLYLPLLLKES